MVEDLTSVAGFARSIALGLIEGLRRNKLPATLSGIALLICTAFALTSDFDERPFYRESSLPKIQKAEKAFFERMEAADGTTFRDWKIYFFIDAHKSARAALQV